MKLDEFDFWLIFLLLVSFSLLCYWYDIEWQIIGNIWASLFSVFASVTWTHLAKKNELMRVALFGWTFLFVYPPVILFLFASQLCFIELPQKERNIWKYWINSHGNCHIFVISVLPLTRLTNEKREWFILHWQCFQSNWQHWWKLTAYTNRKGGLCRMVRRREKVIFILQ